MVLFSSIKNEVVGYDKLATIIQKTFVDFSKQIGFAWLHSSHPMVLMSIEFYLQLKTS